MAEVVDNHDGQGQCYFCGHKPEFLARMGEHYVCQHCLADASARLAFETDRHFCGECRAYMPGAGAKNGSCHRHPPVRAGHGWLFPDVYATTVACWERLARDRFRAGSAPSGEARP